MTKLQLTIAGLLVFFGAALRLDGAILDRLVVEINTVPFTQRQIESYVTTKASLIKVSNLQGGDTLVFNAGNWRGVVDLFSDDMVILQEAQRLGSFQPAEAMVAEAVTILKNKSQGPTGFAQAFQRLGLDEPGLARYCGMILRLEAYRRSKNKQSQSGQGKGVGDSGRPKWLQDLTSRSVVRIYRGGDVFQTIEPSYPDAAPVVGGHSSP